MANGPRYGDQYCTVRASAVAKIQKFEAIKITQDKDACSLLFFFCRFSWVLNRKIHVSRYKVYKIVTQYLLSQSQKLKKCIVINLEFSHHKTFQSPCSFRTGSAIYGVNTKLKVNSYSLTDGAPIVQTRPAICQLRKLLKITYQRHLAVSSGTKTALGQQLSNSTIFRTLHPISHFFENTAYCRQPHYLFLFPLQKHLFHTYPILQH